MPVQNILNFKDIFFVAAVVISFYIAVRYVERHSIFFPMRDIESNPDLVGISFENVDFKTEDGLLLHGWYIPKEGAADTIFFCHGNAGNISHRLEKITIFHKMGLNIFIFDYRGYGKSQGSPSEKGLYRDAEAAYKYLISRGDVLDGDIILYGESIGAAVAIEMALRHKVKALITEESFTSIRDMLAIFYPFLPHFLLESRFDSSSKISMISIPKLIIHSSDDEIVPFYLGEKLFRMADSPREFLKLRGSHNTAFFDSEDVYIKGITSFLNKYKYQIDRE